MQMELERKESITAKLNVGAKADYASRGKLLRRSQPFDQSSKW